MWFLGKGCSGGRDVAPGCQNHSQVNCFTEKSHLTCTQHQHPLLPSCQFRSRLPAGRGRWPGRRVSCQHRLQQPLKSKNCPLSPSPTPPPPHPQTLQLPISWPWPPAREMPSWPASPPTIAWWQPSAPASLHSRLCWALCRQSLPAARPPPPRLPLLHPLHPQPPPGCAQVLGHSAAHAAHAGVGHGRGLVG